MKMESMVRIIAGTFILISLALGTWVNHYWYLFTAFVGANLLQSGFSKWCLMEDILRKFGVGKEVEQGRRAA
jgi:Protein of unknown function (DUF2892)